MKTILTHIFIILQLLLISVTLSAQSVNISYNGSKAYYFSERTDLRRYDNGKYKGLLSREVKAFIAPDSSKSTENSYFYDGNFYFQEETKRALIDVAAGVNEAIPSIFKIDDEGKLTMLEDNGFPSFRSFPSYPKQEIRPGEVWEGTAQRAVDPLNKGISTKMPIFVQYSYVRDEVYYEKPVHLIQAQWATRYGKGTSYVDPDGDKDLIQAIGKHSATIYISAETGAALVVRDSVDETFSYSDGNRYQFKGTISLFTEYPPSVDTEIADIIKDDDSIKVQKTDAGLMLTMLDLKFKPDSPELLPGEQVRLNQIAQVLKKAPKSMFLVEGHTAKSGPSDNEMELSLARAHTIVNEMIARGIPSDRFICKGSGSKKPIADNSTPEGRAINRRVEITICY